MRDCVEKILVFRDKLGIVGENELHVAKREKNATVEIARKLYVIFLSMWLRCKSNN